MLFISHIKLKKLSIYNKNSSDEDIPILPVTSFSSLDEDFQNNKKSKKNI
jgi:hypothetical protein